MAGKREEGTPVVISTAGVVQNGNGVVSFRTLKRVRVRRHKSSSIVAASSPRGFSSAAPKLVVAIVDRDWWGFRGFGGATRGTTSIASPRTRVVSVDPPARERLGANARSGASSAGRRIV